MNKFKEYVQKESENGSDRKLANRMKIYRNSNNLYIQGSEGVIFDGKGKATHLRSSSAQIIPMIHSGFIMDKSGAECKYSEILHGTVVFSQRARTK